MTWCAPFVIKYKVCPKSNETGVIKTLSKILKYTKVKFLQCKSPSTLKHLCICFFQDSIHSWKAFSRIFLSSVVVTILIKSMLEKWVPFRTDLILGKRKKSQGPDWENMGVFLGCDVPLCEKLTNTKGCVSRSVIVMEHPCVGFVDPQGQRKQGNQSQR